MLGLEHQFRPYGLVVISVVPGAGLEPARPQWPGDFKCLAPYSRYIPVQFIATQTSTIKPFLLY